LVDVQKFDQSFQDIILNSENLDTLKKVILEFRKSEILKAHGVSASKKLLFCGPPGCGKTLAARIVSSELMIPLLYTRFDVIVSSYLGETSANLRKIFDFSTQSTWVVLFDEFDAIGKNRSDDGEHGELKRVINSFLQLLDTFKGNSLIIAATNHEGLLDPALWRRFDEIIYFDRPDSKQILSLIESKLQSFKHDKFNETIAKRFSGLTHADVERVCFESIKYCVLQNEDIVTETVLLRALKTQLKRAAIVKSAKVKLR
jgi:SpoVK/Ycf46/Vps4 family AAA+-type ATPase